MLAVDEIQESAEAFWRERGLRPEIAFRTRSVEAVRSLVATGAGVAVLPDLVYRPWSLEGDRIEARPTVEPLPPVRVGVVWRRGSRLSEPQPLPRRGGCRGRARQAEPSAISDISVLHFSICEGSTARGKLDRCAAGSLCAAPDATAAAREGESSR